MVVLYVILVITILILFLYLMYNRLNYFSNRSIKSPPIRSILFGHLYDLWSAPLYSEQLRQWTCQYGPVYGLFEGFRPVYVISDIKLIEEIFVKQFSCFHRRRTTLTACLLGEKHLNVFSSYIIEQWKKQRTILNPTFSGAKMRRLLPTVQTCIDLFIEKLRLISNEQEINIKEISKRLTMDIICLLKIIFKINK